MPLLELPHTPGCLVCGKQNPHGLQLHLHVDDQTGTVQTTFTPSQHHIGFEGIIHGGILATVIDEIMVWAATWHCRCFCVCAELNVRFRSPATVGQPLNITSRISQSRGKITYTEAAIENPQGLVATATGKYMSMTPERHRAFVATLVNEPTTAAAAATLSGSSRD